MVRNLRGPGRGPHGRGPTRGAHRVPRPRRGGLQPGTVDCGKRTRATGLRLLPADALDSLPPVRHLDANHEIPTESLVSLYGASGAGKTFAALDYAARTAQSSPVVYIAGEGAVGLASRKLAWCKHHQLRAGELFFVPQAVNMLDPAEVNAIISLIAPLRPALLVIDTLARCMIGGDENSARDMGLFVAACDEVRVATGATILIVHHTGKDGRVGARQLGPPRRVRSNDRPEQRRRTDHPELREIERLGPL